MVGMFMIPSCEDNTVEEVSLEPMMQLWVNGDYINPYTYYAQINTYGEKVLGEDGKIKKLFVLHLQREVSSLLVKVGLGMMVMKKIANESATFGPVKGWEYLIKWSEGRQWGDEYLNQEYWLRYIGDWMMVKVGMTELGLEDINYVQGDLRVH
jgi:hypothetical protein